MSLSITTERLSITPLSTEDRSFILELVNTQGWIEFIGDRNVHSDSDADAYIRKILDNTDVRYWTVRIKSDQKKAGVITLIKRDYLDHPDIGFAFLPACSGKGYAREAADAVLAYVMQAYNPPQILATTLPHNAKSIQLLKKLGLTFEKEMEVNEEKLLLFGASADKLQLDRITQTFFMAFTNKDGRQPDLEVLSEICIPQVMLIHQMGNDHTVYNLSSFIKPRREILSNGSLREFEELETGGYTSIRSDIAQRSSEYQKSGIRNEQPFEQQGHKIFQFLKTGQGWRISAVLWQDE